MPNEYEIEIVEVNVIDGGIEVFARAWKNGVQLGFGSDGTIDIERFRIFNPPILVNDPLGDIIIPASFDDIAGMAIPERRLREDPIEAIRQSLTHTISLVGRTDVQIQPGKRGNTTSTFYSAAGDGSISAASTVWATARDATTGTAVDNEATRYMMADKDGATYTVTRAYFPIDTSAIPDGDTISSATFSVDNDGFLSGSVLTGLIQTTTASDSSIVAGDFDALTLNSPTEGTDARVALTSTGYKDFVMNASGISWVSKTGYTKLGLRISNDIDNSAPTVRNYVHLYHSEQTGTTNDPKLVVVHSAAAATFIPRISFIM